MSFEGMESGEKPSRDCLEARFYPVLPAGKACGQLKRHYRSA